LKAALFWDIQPIFRCKVEHQTVANIGLPVGTERYPFALYH
jgi:hypothetical protein